MIDAKTPRTKAAKPAAQKTDTKKNDTKKTEDIFAMSQVELPEAFRGYAETGMENAKQSYAQFTSATEEATGVAEEALQTARDGFAELNLKALETAKQTADANFDFFRQMFTVKSVSEVFELQTKFASERFEAVTGQTAEFQEAAGKLTAELSKPVKDAFSKTVNAA